MDANLVVRIIVLVAALVNQILVATGKNPLPFADETIYELASVIVTVAVAIWNAWKNNNFTSEAQVTQKILNALKKGQTTIEEVESLLNGSTDIAESEE